MDRMLETYVRLLMPSQSWIYEPNKNAQLPQEDAHVRSTHRQSGATITHLPQKVENADPHFCRYDGSPIDV